MFSHYPKRTLKKFGKFHRDNPQVYSEFRQLAEEMQDSGRRFYSAQAIIYHLRYKFDLRTTGVDFKISNDFTSIYARMLILKRPRFKNFFRLKGAK